MPTVCYDLKRKKPGCALLQAAMGASVSADVFPLEDWLTYPTPDLKVYELTESQLQILVSLHHLRRQVKLGNHP